MTGGGCLPLIATESADPKYDLRNFLLGRARAMTVEGLQHPAQPRALLPCQSGVGRYALSDRELKGRKDKLAKFLGDIRAGRFPAEVSSRTCPNCPAFFICGQTPDGPLQKKFV